MCFKLDFFPSLVYMKRNAIRTGLNFRSISHPLRIPGKMEGAKLFSSGKRREKTFQIPGLLQHYPPVLNAKPVRDRRRRTLALNSLKIVLFSNSSGMSDFPSIFMQLTRISFKKLFPERHTISPIFGH